MSITKTNTMTRLTSLRGLSSKEHEKNAHDSAVNIMNLYSDEEYFKTFHSSKTED